MDALQSIYVFAQLALELDEQVAVMNHVFAKLDQVGKTVEATYQKVGDRADAFLARAAGFDGKIDNAFTPHEIALDAADDKLHALEGALDRLSNAPLDVSTDVSGGGTENPPQPSE